MSAWRVSVFLPCLAVGIVSAFFFGYGLLQLDAMGWPHTPLQLMVILVALAMFVLFGSGIAVFGLGVLARNGRAQVAGVAASLFAVVVYFTLFYLAN